MKLMLIIAAFLALGAFAQEARAQQLNLETPHYAEYVAPIDLRYEEGPRSFGVLSPLIREDRDEDRLVLVTPELRLFGGGISFYEIRVSCPDSLQDYGTRCAPDYEGVRAYGGIFRVRF